MKKCKEKRKGSRADGSEEKKEHEGILYTSIEEIVDSELFRDSEGEDLTVVDSVYDL